MFNNCLIKVKLFKGEDVNFFHSFSCYVIASVHSPSYQFAVHGSDVGNNGVTDTRVRIKTNTQIYM